MTLKPLYFGLTVGRWRLVRLLGRGGNGEVWLAEDSGGEQAAVKFLSKIKDVAYQRFTDEVRVMRECGVPGVVSAIDSSLPLDPASERPWYAMPVGKPLVDALKNAPLSDKVLAIAGVADTLAELHSQSIAHRDIKPSNLLMISGKPCLGDFGLVDYPDKVDVTGKREAVGPRWTMAPEVQREGAAADARPADVYSLAKTLWVLVTGIEKGFEGQYNVSSTVSIDKHAPGAFIEPLEELLKTATDHDPGQRPSMQSLARQLRDWCTLQEAFQERNRLEWIDLLRRLFPVMPPRRAEWTDLDQIVTILNVLGARSNMNHLFFPFGGGLDLSRATHSAREPGCIELKAGGLHSIVKPARLLFESFDADPEWHYFRLEAAPLEPCGVYQGKTDDTWEEVTDVGGEFYAERWCLDENEYRGEPLPKGSRPLMRFFGGAFVIFQKSSAYNSNPDTYDARHDRMDAETFRAYIQRTADAVRGLRRNAVGDAS